MVHGVMRCAVLAVCWLLAGPALAQQGPVVVNLGVSRVVATEGAREPVILELRLDRPAPASGVCIQLDLAGGNARLNEDFRLLGSIPNVPAGAVRAEVAIQIIDDDLPEPDERIRIELKPSPCYTVGPSAVFDLLIRDDDDDPGALEGRLRALLGQVPDPLVQSQLLSLSRLCATGSAAQGSELARRCQLLRLALRDPAAAQRLIQAIRGLLAEELSSQRRGFRMLVAGQAGALGRRLQAVRGGGGVGLSLDVDGLAPALAFLPLASVEEQAAPFRERGIGVFASYTRGDGDRRATAVEPGYGSDSDTLLLGMDKRLGAEWVLGAGLSHTRFDAGLDGGAGDLELRQTSLLVYASRSLGSGFLDGSLGWGRGSLDQRRVARFAVETDDEAVEAIDRLAARSDTRLFSASLSTGHDWHRGAASFGPRAAIEYSRFVIDGFRERALEGSDAFALAVEKQTVRSLIARLGASAQWAVSTRWGVLTPQLDASWVRQFEDEAGTLEGRFVNAPDAQPFALPGGEVDGHYAEFGVALGWIRAGSGSGYVSYRRLAGVAETSQHFWSLGLRWEF